MKICSLLPSATEIVFALGLGDRLVRVTHECDFPPEARRLPVVTRSAVDAGNGDSREIHQHISAARHAGSSVYALDHDLLARLDPELILTQELCDVCAVSYDLVTQAVRRLHGPRRVLSLSPTNLDGILATIEQVGEAAGVPERAARLVAELQQRIEAVAEPARAALRRPRVLALEWLDPPFVGGHWVPELVRLAGGTCEAGHEGRPSTRVDWSRIAEYDPDIVVLMACGFDLERTIAEFTAADPRRNGWDCAPCALVRSTPSTGPPTSIAPGRGSSGASGYSRRSSSPDCSSRRSPVPLGGRSAQEVRVRDDPRTTHCPAPHLHRCQSPCTLNGRRRAGAWSTSSIVSSIRAS